MIQPLVHYATVQPDTLECVIETLPSGIILLDPAYRIVTANAVGRAYLARLTPSTVGDRLTHLGRYALSALLTPTAIEDLPTQLINVGTPLASYEINVRTLPATGDRCRWMIVLHEIPEQASATQIYRQRSVARNADRLRLQKKLRAHKGKLYKLATSILASTHATVDAVSAVCAPGIEQVAAQAQLVEMQSANAQLARAVRLKDQFWANMSHELRTPLSAILLNGELLQRNLFGTLTTKQTQYVQRMMDSTNHLLALINGILELTRTDAGYTELTFANVDIHRLCLASIQMVKEQAHHKRIQIAFEWDEQAASLRVDEARFKQILVNLLTNAVTFTPEKGKIGLKVTVDGASDAVYFAVWDTGIGIAESDIPRLFQRFVKLNNTVPHAHSTGLSLAHVVQLIRLHGGNLDVDSTLGRGSCFTVGLPCTPPIITEAPLPPSTMAHTVPRSASFVQQLSATAHELAVALIEQNVCLVVDQQMNNVAEQIQQHVPDVILLDLTVEDAAGWHMLPAVVQAAKQQGIPVIVVDDIHRFPPANHVGADVYLNKPVTREHMRSAFSTVMPGGAFLRTALLLLPTTPRKPLARILVVEELGMTGSALVDYLWSMGYDVALATTALTALSLAQKLKPHLVLLDLQMSGLDSALTTHQLRALPTLHDLPVIGITALTLPGDQARLWAAGINGYVSKPFDFGKLLATIEQLLPHPGAR